MAWRDHPDRTPHRQAQHGGLISSEGTGYPMRVTLARLKSNAPEAAIILLALALRCWWIEIKPPHFDEAINGWFADRITSTGLYSYDPSNYHGPLHFYLVWIFQTLFGRELWALRAPAILAGVLSVAAMLRFRVFFGEPVSRFAALAMALSPAFVFYGRYSIHESWQVLFSILLLQGILGLWQTGRRRWLFSLCAGLAGMVLTKETYVLHAGCFVLAGVVLWIWGRIVPSRPAWPIARQSWTRDDAILGLGIGALAIVFFYSGAFLDFTLLQGLYQTFALWISTGVEASGHEKTAHDLAGPLNYYWIALMARYEWPALAGLAAGLRFAAPSDARFRYIAISAGGVLLAYSIIPYKTPWCVISILWPFYLLLGEVLRELAHTRSSRRVWWAAVPLLAVSTGVMLKLNFRDFTNEKEPYVYVQTYSDIYDFVDPVLAAAEADQEGRHMHGAIILDSYYPLPWMLGDFTRIGYYPVDKPPELNALDFFVIESSREKEIEDSLRFPFFKVPFRIRSGQEGCTSYFSVPRFAPVFNREPEFQPWERQQE